MINITSVANGRSFCHWEGPFTKCASLLDENNHHASAFSAEDKMSLLLQQRLVFEKMTMVGALIVWTWEGWSFTFTNEKWSLRMWLSLLSLLVVASDESLIQTFFGAKLFNSLTIFWIDQRVRHQFPSLPHCSRVVTAPAPVPSWNWNFPSTPPFNVFTKRTLQKSPTLWPISLTFN